MALSLKVRQRTLLDAWQWLPNDLEEAGRVAAVLQIADVGFRVSSDKRLIVRVTNGLVLDDGDWLIFGPRGFDSCEREAFDKEWEVMG